jgi:putative N6-adenine-specific DNA methylase
MKLDLIAVVLFGLESVVSRELKELGIEVIKVEDGRVTFTGDETAIHKSNLWLRSAERVLIKIGEFDARSFEELFEKTKKLNWAKWLLKDSAFPVKGYALKSKLYSIPDCQSIIKKAVVEKLRSLYNTNWLEENGPVYQIQFSILKDRVTLMIDTSGEGLHKRGYRELSNAAPLRETLAAAMINLSFWDSSRPFCDPFCGSGTIPIEAALIGANIAPGLQRDFSFLNWSQIDKNVFKKFKKEAYEKINRDIKMNIMGADIDNKAILLSKDNALKASVDEHIKFYKKDVIELEKQNDYGCIICNPPYGERLGELKNIEKLYRDLNKIFKKFDSWSHYILTSHEKFELIYGKKADKRRKLYNGMIKCTYYQYYGPRPPREV